MGRRRFHRRTPRRIPPHPVIFRRLATFPGRLCSENCWLLYDRDLFDRASSRANSPRTHHAPPLASIVVLAIFMQLCSAFGAAQAITRLCNPVLTRPIVVVSSEQRTAAAAKAQPPLTDTFDWPDTPLGVIKTAEGYECFGKRRRSALPPRLAQLAEVQPAA